MEKMLFGAPEGSQEDEEEGRDRSRGVDGHYIDETDIEFEE